MSKKLKPKTIKLGWVIAMTWVLLFTSVSNAQPTLQLLNGPNGGDCMSLAKSESTLYAGLFRSGVYCSTDGGINWTLQYAGGGQFNQMLPFDTTAMFIINGNTLYRYTLPSQTRTIVGNAFLSLYQRGNVLFAGTHSQGVRRSTNLGDTWEYRNNGLLDFVVQNITGFGDSTLFCSVESGGIYRSINNGILWTSFGLDTAVIKKVVVSDTLLYATSNYSFFRTSVNQNQWVFIAPISLTTSLDKLPNGNILLCSDQSLLLEYNLLTNQSTPRNGPPAWIQSMLVIDNSTWIAGVTYRGIYKTTNAGVTWTPHYNGLIGTFPFDVALYNNRLYCGHSNGQTKYYTPTSGWQGGPTFPYSISKFAVWGNRLLAGGFWGGLFYTDNGDTWQVAMGVNDRITVIMTYDSTTAFATTSSISGYYKTTDRGLSWTLTDTLSGIIAMMRTHQGTIIASHQLFGLYRSTNLGQTWQRTHTGMHYNGVVQTPSGAIFAGSAYGDGYWPILIKSTNDGLNWTPCNQQIGMMGLTTDRNGTLYFGDATYHPIRYSTDEGNNWDSIRVEFPAPISAPQISCLRVSDNGVVYCGFFALGVASSISPVVSVNHQSENSQIPNSFDVKAYPNPFNPTTNIRVDIPKNTHIKVLVFDYLGRLVTTVADKEVVAGRYNFQWNGSRVASGVYFVMVKTLEFSHTRKMVLLK